MRTERSADSQALLHRALADPSRVRILEALRESGEPRDARELAATVGLHVNTVRSHLRQLAAADLVRARRDAQGKPGRPHIVFEAAEAPTEGPPALAAYRLLAGALMHSAAGDPAELAEGAESAALAAARDLDVDRAGSESDPGPLGQVTGLLARLGFDPELSRPGDRTGAGGEIVMHACPFEDLGPADLEIACSVHRGLIRGALPPEGGAPRASVELQREQGSCVARLAAAG